MYKLTTDKPVKEMGMVELAHNSCYAEDRKARYRDYEENIDARAFTRNLMVIYGVWSKESEIEELTDDDIFDEVMLESLMCDAGDIQGLIAIFYRNLWAQADLYETLKAYEETGLSPEQIREMVEELKRWHESKVNANIKNPFASSSTVCCCNCDHKDEYIEELEQIRERLK